MRSQKIIMNASKNWDNIQQKVEDPVIIVNGAKIHRANILARIIHSLSFYKMEWSYCKIRTLANIRKKGYPRLGLGINRIFRRNAYENKFNAMQKIKQELLDAEQNQIRQSQKTIKYIQRSSKNILFLVLKAKRKEILASAFQKIKLHSIQSHYKKRNNHRNAMRKILKILLQNKRFAFDALYSSRASVDKRLKITNLVKILMVNRKDKLSWGIWKFRKNLLQKRRQQVQNDIKIFETKINNSSDTKIQAVKQRKGKLQQHINKIQRQTNSMQSQLMSQHQQLQNQRRMLQIKISQLQLKKNNLLASIQQSEKQINSPFSIDEIYQCVYHNFLLFLHQNKEKVYNKEQILKSLTYPLIPIDVPIETIKQENQVMQELLTQYLVMFGTKKLEGEIQLPYEYLVKENQVMYRMLITLLPKVNGDRDDLRVIRSNLFKLNSKIKQIWKE